MNMIKKLLVFVALLLAPAMSSAQSNGQDSGRQRYEITISNPNPFAMQQVVEIDTAGVLHGLGIGKDVPFRILNAAGQELGTQITYDGKLLVFASVRPSSSWTVYAEKGMSQKPKCWVYGNIYKSRKDDIAWENDRCAYRVYGPPLQATGEKSYGIDVWVKNTPDLVLVHRYKLDHEGNVVGDSLERIGLKTEADSVNLATSFHLDHGDGMDGYGVGPTLGCGTPALIDGGRLILPYCYKDYKILDNGPLRFTVRLDYGRNAEGVDYHEHRIISLDRGSHFNKITVWYDSITKPVTFCAGVVLNGDGKLTEENGCIMYADPTDRPDVHGSTIYVAALFPNDTVSLGKTPDGRNAVGMIPDYTGQPVTYYSGAAWSDYDAPDFDTWHTIVNKFIFAKKLVVVNSFPSIN